MVILHDSCFNPRTYIRYDTTPASSFLGMQMFQSTYLYKVRQLPRYRRLCLVGFNPRTYIRYDIRGNTKWRLTGSFNPRTYIRYDLTLTRFHNTSFSFNPRTYIRYDVIRNAFTVFINLFQSTYLYKVRPFCQVSLLLSA